MQTMLVYSFLSALDKQGKLRISSSWRSVWQAESLKYLTNTWGDLHAVYILLKLEEVDGVEIQTLKG